MKDSKEYTLVSIKFKVPNKKFVRFAKLLSEIKKLIEK